jgi:hypothetical protein
MGQLEPWENSGYSAIGLAGGFPAALMNTNRTAIQLPLKEEFMLSSQTTQSALQRSAGRLQADSPDPAGPMEAYRSAVPKPPSLAHIRRKYEK